MQTYEEASSGIEREKKKAVTFAAEIAEQPQQISGVMTFYRDATKKRRSIDLIKKRIYACLGEKRYDELSGMLSSCVEEDLDAVCDKYGRAIFRLAIADREAVQLRCLIDNIPGKIVHEKVLCSGNFYLLEGFLGQQRIQEESGHSTLEMKEVLAEKLKIIFAMGYDDVNNFIKNSVDCKFIVDRGLKLRY